MDIRFLFLFLIPVLMGCEPDPPTSEELPFYGPMEVVERELNGASVLDTVLYTVPRFSFTNQDGEVISHRDYEGHVYIADFFFGNCPSICPILSSQLARVQDRLKADSLLGTVLILSHTVDPTRDTVEALRAYADRLDADTRYWNFVTGKKDALYYQAEEGYLVTAFESDTAAGGFFHTDQFALIDEQMHIRGYYDGTSTIEVDSMYKDLLKLLNHTP
ncbi:MAG: SCO family protein [Flavobacteriales bacterium]|nr:SCO family protein [Flavobacteriales bacterium]